jgi:hypothetical protein
MSNSLAQTRCLEFTARNNELYKNDEENNWVIGGGWKTTFLLLIWRGKLRHI